MDTDAIKDIGGKDVHRALELPKDVSERLEELEKLSEKAESGDKEARRELRRAVKKYRAGDHRPRLGHRQDRPAGARQDRRSKRPAR